MEQPETDEHLRNGDVMATALVEIREYAVSDTDRELIDLGLRDEQYIVSIMRIATTLCAYNPSAWFEMRRQLLQHDFDFIRVMRAGLDGGEHESK